jgi:TolA-binding protein
MSFSMLLASLLAATPTSSAAPPALASTSPPWPAVSRLAPAPADDGDDAYQVLASLCERELHELAVREGEAFLRDYPRHEQRHLARYRLADALFALERTGEAVAHYRKLVRLERFPYRAESWFRLGQCELEAGELPTAGEALEQVLASDATYLHLPATHLMGEVAFRAGDHAAARPRYEAVLAADSAGEYAPLARRGLAWGAWKLGEHDRAAKEARAFLDSYPKSPLADEVRFVLGEAHLAAGRQAPALEAFRAIGAGEYADAALRGQGFAHAGRADHPAAAEAFGALVERHPQSRYLAEAALQQGVHLLRAGDAERAVTALAHESIAADPEALAWRARALRELGRSEKALGLVEGALAARPAQALEAELRVLRGDLLLDLGRGAEAARELERSGSDYALHAAAVAHMNEGRPDDAARLAGELLSRSPDSEYVPHALLVLGEARLARGESSAADEALSALIGTPGAPAELVARGLSRLGWCRYLAGQPGSACAPLERLRARHPEAPEVEEAR